MANPVLMNGMASPVSIFETVNENPGHPIGARGSIEDRVFRWTKFNDSTAIGPNKLVQAMPPIAAHVSEATGAPFTANDTRISMVLGATAAAQNMYREGYLKIEDATLGIGQIFKLRGHDFVAASGTLTADIYDPVTTTTTGSEVTTLIANPWANVVIQPTTVTAATVGVTMVNFAAASTASVATPGYEQTATSTWTQPRYGWVQTWGLASVLQDTTDIVAGSGVVVGAVAGSIGVETAAGIAQRVGYAMEALATNSKYASVFLQIAP